ncbi:MAG: Uncharacterized protein G01um101418_30 [Parcubacteria group bacterium Gr01-1014_18]|nr:MAG: Uncharacterized protein Greene041636_30 [Parcubacteria group bacterium Greene0416_36]TSC81536.1 MAG: Uncharacterized protein G01um101418_30 [Parcubacteria group bacterium Gr01-1014_18]TSC99653.1 MAG: Uncharacterized protein Greene101420_57 [Parcubacteria group bacterium Greene1014_20]TSD07104.1 MAG: Uncharacterized protein Greene07142_416 [Parcubacteria group bacterium Greene0714_2]
MITLHISAKNFDLTPAIKSLIEDKIGNLDKFYSRIIDGRVEVEKTTHHHKGDVFRAIVNLNAGDLIRAESVAKNLDEAVVEVKKILEMELKKAKEKLHAKDQKEGVRAKNN